MMVLSSSKILLAHLTAFDIVFIIIVAVLGTLQVIRNFRSSREPTFQQWILCGLAGLAIIAVFAGRGFFRYRDSMKVTFPNGISANEYKELCENYKIVDQDGMILTIVDK